VQELRGEKIDIVTWDPDPAKFICNALSPAEIVRVIVDEGNQSMEVVVPDDQLSLAIGKRGQNVRLASRLTGWKLDVTSETNYNQALKDGYRSLLDLKGIGPKWASELYEEGFRSAEDVARATVEDLLSVEGMTEKRAEQLIEDATNYIASVREQERKDAEEAANVSGDEEIEIEMNDGDGSRPEEGDRTEESADHLNENEDGKG